MSTELTKLAKLSQLHMDEIAAVRIKADNGEIGYWKIYATLANLDVC